MDPDLVSELTRELDRQFFLARFDWRLTQALFLVAVGASVVSSLAAALERLRRQTLACLAAVPALVLLVDSTFNLEERAMWHYEKAAGVQGLLRELRDQGADPAEVSKRLTELEGRLNPLWPEMGRPFPSGSGSE